MAIIKKGGSVVELKRICTELPCIDDSDHDIRILAPESVIETGPQASLVVQATVANNTGGCNVVQSFVRELVMSIAIFRVDTRYLYHSGRGNHYT